jgi:hypothetical protein
MAMAFSEIELKFIENTVGKMCHRRSPEHLKGQIRIIYKVINHSVEVCEQRPGWKKPEEWTSTGVAKFIYARTTRKWKLYWMRQDLKWHLYEPLPESTTIDRLVVEVDKDPHGAFFG